MTMLISPSVFRKPALWPLLAMFAYSACASASCEDFLAALHSKPENLQFLGCKQRTDLQGQPWEASYRVSGKYAAAVETSLARQWGMKKLQRTCCAWESMQNSFRDRKDRLFVIEMSTEETPVDARNRWPEIPYFHVTLRQYPEDP